MQHSSSSSSPISNSKDMQHNNCDFWFASILSLETESGRVNINEYEFDSVDVNEYESESGSKRVKERGKKQ